jgi:hypothetical protein
MPQLMLGGVPVTTHSSRLPALQPGRDPVEEAETAWLSAQVASFELEDLERDLESVYQAQERARGWFDRNDSTNRHYLEAYRRRNALDNHERDLEVLIWSQSRMCWVSCCDTYVLLQYVPAASGWYREHAPELVGVQHPDQIWNVLLPGRPAPGHWPMEERDWWIERRPHQLETWHRLEMQSRLLALRQEQVS